MPQQNRLSDSGRRRLVLVAAILIGLGGCATDNPALAQRMTPAALVPDSAADVVDARAEFERITCRINDERGRQFPDFRDCHDIFTAVGAVPPAPRVERREPCCFTLVFVPGIFGECVAHLGTPFSDSHDRLRQHGHDVHVIPVGGRASSEANGRLIASYLAGRDAQLGRVVLVGYSKGVPDILEALAVNADAGWAKKVRAVVSVAGVVSGTPAADLFAGLYDALFARLPWKNCPPQDGGGLDSLTRKARLQSLARSPLPRSVKFLSLVALPGSAGVNPVLFPFQHALNEHGANDGQVLAYDAVIPGSTLLGYLNGDHWAVAVPFNRSHSIEAAVLRIANAFPREVLIDAVLEYVAGTLE